MPKYKVPKRTRRALKYKGRTPSALLLPPDKRLDRIREIIEAVDNRCMAADGPVTPTGQEMRQSEISAIYALACGKPENWAPN